MVCALGAAVTVKSGGGGGGLITNVTAALCVSVPVVPVIVSGALPTGVLLVVVTLTVTLPAPLTVLELKLDEALAGRPVTLKFTVPLNPLSAPTVTV